MSPAVVLLVLRLLSALLLLAFLAAIAWLIYRDLQAAAAEVVAHQQQHGLLRLLGEKNGMAEETDTVFPLLTVTSLGRAANNTIVLDDNYASSEHVLVTRRGQHWWLEDLGSRNGTLLNDAPVEGATVVSAGDVITIGDTRLKIEL
jgi:hypothetical protein